MTRSHGHVHGKSCYWDMYRCGWVCGASETAPTAPFPEEPGSRLASPAGGTDEKAAVLIAEAPAATSQG
ncbi:hypothetical protein [Pseudonocardia acidicola]|uniref:Uncharacterized protein n=1 Tax=Pseudonocardia acidicola TaxID=2724939 RepID=A0ABX1S5Q2_9PSEU|nr:hypothetical protein [Pseudonocardia acidicola]NMH96239.1 hypothetical protein [Pseudonocardia acidicola]